MLSTRTGEAYPASLGRGCERFTRAKAWRGVSMSGLGAPGSAPWEKVSATCSKVPKRKTALPLHLFTSESSFSPSFHPNILSFGRIHIYTEDITSLESPFFDLLLSPAAFRSQVSSVPPVCNLHGSSPSGQVPPWYTMAEAFFSGSEEENKQLKELNDKVVS